MCIHVVNHNLYVSASNRETIRYSGFYQHHLIIINHPNPMYVPSLLIQMPVMMANTLFRPDYLKLNLPTSSNHLIDLIIKLESVNQRLLDYFPVFSS